MDQLLNPADLRPLNSAGVAEAVAMIAPFIENSPEIAARVAGRRPFNGLGDLLGALSAELGALSAAERLALLRAHPDLAPREAATLTSASREEQARLGLTAADPEIAERFDSLNRRYAAKFGFPCIIALHRHATLASVFKSFEGRLRETRDSEMERALAEVMSVSEARILAAFRPAREAQA